jgi:hypothetical protein
VNPRTADQGDADATVLPASLGEQFDLDAVGAREPPGGDRGAMREHDLQLPTGASSSTIAASSA